MNYGKILVMVSVLVGLMVACAPGEAPSNPPGALTPLHVQREDSGVVKEGWEVEWERTLAAAKRERSVVVYAGGSVGIPMRESLALIKKQFDLQLDVVSGRGSEIGRRVIQEQANGIYMTDILMTGGNTIFGVKSAGATVPLEPALILPEVKQPNLWYGEKLPWADEDRHVFRFFSYPSPEIAINTNLVKSGELQSYYDLLQPKWKGKIVMSDPTVAGSGFNSFSSMIMNKALDLDFYRQLVKQEPHMTRDLRLQTDWLARGKFAISLGNESMAEYQRAGAPITEIIPKEGAYMSAGTGSIVLLNRAPHPNGAKVIINWILSREGQIIMQNVLTSHSGRIDIPTDGVEATRMRKPGVKYHIAANSVEKWVMEEQDKYIEMAQEVFAPLLK